MTATVRPLTSRSPTEAEFIREIIVMVDDLRATTADLLTAAPLARHFGVPLHLLAVHPANGSGAQYSSLRSSLDDAARWLGDHVGELGPAIDTRIVVGDRSVCPICETYPNALVIHSLRAPIGQLGIAVEQLDRIARHVQHHGVIVVGPSVTDEWRPGPIGVALDGSTIAETAVATATAWASALGETLEIVQVVPSANHGDSNTGCSDYLRGVERALHSIGVPARCATIVSEDVAGSITHHMRDRGCTFAAIATAGHRGRHAFGRVAMDLISQSACPVHIAWPYRTSGQPTRP